MAVLSALHGMTSTILSNLFITLPLPVATPDLPNQAIIVTGSNTGLGLEASRHLLRLGVRKLIMGVRDLSKGEAARAELLKSTDRSPESVEVWHLDMEDYDSVRTFARRATTLPRLDGVLANAGVLPGKFTLTGSGIEKTVAVNVVSTYLLFLLVLPKLRESPSSTANFVVPNSALHYLAPVRDLGPSPEGRSIFSRLNEVPAGDVDMLERYNVSKLLCIYVTRELAASMSSSSASGKEGKGKRDGGAQVVVNTPNPSYCKSGLMREAAAAPPDFMARSTEMGSRALVHGLLAGAESSGQYLTNCHVQTPACHVVNETGRQIQKAFFDELMQELESIAPGVTANL